MIGKISLTMATGVLLTLARAEIASAGDAASMTGLRQAHTPAAAEPQDPNPLFSLFGAALDLERGKMYWTSPSTARIRRANLDGTKIEDIVTEGLINPHQIVLDTAAGKIYWTDKFTRKVQRANLDGTDVEDIVAQRLLSPYGSPWT